MRCNHAQQLKEYIRPDSKDLAPGNIHKLTISYSSITMTVNDTISISSIIYTNFDFLFFVFGIDKRFIKIIDCRIVIILIHMLAWTDGSFRLLIFILAAKSSRLTFSQWSPLECVKSVCKYPLNFTSKGFCALHSSNIWQISDSKKQNMASISQLIFQEILNSLSVFAV